MQSLTYIDKNALTFKCYFFRKANSTEQTPFTTQLSYIYIYIYIYITLRKILFAIYEIPRIGLHQINKTAKHKVKDTHAMFCIYN